MSLSARKRTIMISGDIDSDTATELVLKLSELTERYKAPITIYINSGGGSIDDAFAMYDAIRNCKATVTGIATGVCWSSAVLVLQACHMRKATTNTSLMVHAGTMSIGECSPIEGKMTAISYYRDQQRFSTVLRQRTNVSEKLFNKWNTTSKYLSPDKALKYQFIDEIIG